MHSTSVSGRDWCRVHGALCSGIALGTLLVLCSGWWACQGEDLSTAPTPVPPLRIVYFVTQDRQPCRDHVERLTRVMREVQRFYREGMKAAGYGERTFGLETNAAGQLLLHEVRAREASAAYGRDAWDKVRGEVAEALRHKGIDIDQETVVIFETLLRWDRDKAVEVGPYVGSGDHRSGTAWVYDDDRLDPRLLRSKEPGGYYGSPCSLGQFNTHYVGGVAHELGHALGLPHVKETPDQADRGSALMGGGNHTYGEELRGEGKGTFLHPVSAMRLANHRRFAGERPRSTETPDCQLLELRAVAEGGRLRVEGRVTSDIDVFGVVAYDDWGKVESDYDAYGWVGRLEGEGRFRVELGVLRPGPSQVRLTVVHANGRTTEFPIDYQVDAGGGVNVETFRK